MSLVPRRWPTPVEAVLVEGLVAVPDGVGGGNLRPFHRLPGCFTERGRSLQVAECRPRSQSFRFVSLGVLEGKVTGSGNGPWGSRWSPYQDLRSLRLRPVAVPVRETPFQNLEECCKNFPASLVRVPKVCVSGRRTRS